MLTEKAYTLCLLEILKEYSDAEHILSVQKLQTLLQTTYGIKPDRRTIYGAVALLLDLGYDISVYEENGSGYYLRTRDLEQTEVLLLTDAVYAFPFIPARQSEQLITKLQKQLSIHQRKRYRHLTLVRPERKADNRQVFWNIEQLDEAIAKKKQVSLMYLHYGMDKKQHETKPYTLSPYEMVYMNEHYYLSCLPEHVDCIRLFRIDRMKDITILEVPRRECANAKREARDATYAFVGAPEQIVMHCNNSVLDDVLDRFGTDIQLHKRDADSFTASFTVPPRGIHYWALQYLSYVEIERPAWLRNEIVESLKANPYLRQGETCYGKGKNTGGDK